MIKWQTIKLLPDLAVWMVAEGRAETLNPLGMQSGMASWGITDEMNETLNSPHAPRHNSICSYELAAARGKNWEATGKRLEKAGRGVISGDKHGELKDYKTDIDKG